MKNAVSNDWFIALVFLVVFFLTHGYRYGWDDQHLEIPLLKHIIDPELYRQDYYVQSLFKNFTTYFYILLARFITIDQIPFVYFSLFIFSRYFLFFWIFKFWKFLAKDRVVGFACTLAIFVLTRIVEFFYQTFSHQEFTLPFAIAGFYFFYQERFFLASALLGIACNFHAIYSLLPFLYMISYLVFSRIPEKFSLCLKSGFIYLGFSFPFFLWSLQRILSALPDQGHSVFATEGWLSLFKLAAPEAFLFREVSIEEVLNHPLSLLFGLQLYLFLIAIYVLNCVHHEEFRKESKNHVVVLTSFCLLAIYFVAGYVFPNKFILTLNLYRSTQFLIFILMGYTTILAMQAVKSFPPWKGLWVGILFTNLALMDMISAICCVMLIILLFLKRPLTKKDWHIWFSVLIGFLVSSFCLIEVFQLVKINPLTNPKFLLRISLLLTVFLILKLPGDFKRQIFLRQFFILIPLLFFTYLYIERYVKESIMPLKGYALLHNQWEDIQYYVKRNTPKSAILLVPYDMEMGGFRIHSERSIVCCDRDKGIVGFDFQRAKEWEKRREDIIGFKVLKEREDIRVALGNSIVKYGVDYVVFMNYYAPKPSATFQRLYSNNFFSLYQISRDKTPKENRE